MALRQWTLDKDNTKQNLTKADGLDCKYPRRIRTEMTKT
jgi:hypothetical protein